MMLDGADLCIVMWNGTGLCRMVLGATEWHWMVRNSTLVRDDTKKCGMVLDASALMRDRA